MLVKQQCRGNEEHSSEGIAMTGDSKVGPLVIIKCVAEWRYGSIYS